MNAPGTPYGMKSQTERFAFSYGGLVGAAARLSQMGGRGAYVEIDDDTFTARFGPWIVRTPLANIAEVCVTGPYLPWKVIGPARVSFADGGLTFATDTRQGVCIQFREPVAGAEPTGRFRHPALTVTVEDPVGLMAALAS